MKGVQIDTYGGPDVLKINGVSKPELKDGQVLVEVHAASINPFDVKILSGAYKDSISLTFPWTLGGDFAGIVTDVAADVTEFKRGDEVYGSAQKLGGGSGSFAEIAAANTKNTSLMPKSLNFEEAASLPLVGASAVQALEEHINLQKDQKILMHGGAGGIGHVAIQVAKAIGAHVITTVGTDDVEYVKSLGADEVIDYKTQKFEDMVKEVDAVFDTVGGETTNKSLAVLKKGGVLVSILFGQPNKELAKKHNITPVSQNTQTNAPHLKRLAKLVDVGHIKPHVDKVFPLEQVKEAFTYQKEGHPRGKVVLKIK